MPWAGWTQQFACNDFYWYGNTGCNDPSMYFDLEWNVDRMSHEVRLASSGDGPLNWIAGAFYEETESHQIAFWGMPGIQHGGVPSAYYLSNGGGSPLPEEWQQGPGALGYAQATYAYTGDSWNQLVASGYVEFAPRLQAPYETLDARVGWNFQDGRYGVELYATNLFDEQAQIFINTAQADQRITTIRPRTFGVRLSSRFD